MLISTGWTCCQLHWADLVSYLESKQCVIPEVSSFLVAV